MKRMTSPLSDVFHFLRSLLRGMHPYALLSLFIIVTACSTAAPVSRTSPTAAVPTVSPVLLVEPIVQCKDISNDFKDIPNTYGWLGKYFVNMSTQVLSGKGFQVSANEEINALALRCKSEDPASDIYSTIDKPSKEELIREIANIAGTPYIMVIKMAVYKGPGGTWDPNTGAITSSMNRTQMRAKLVDVSSSKVIWKNEVQYNGLPDQGNEKFNQMVPLLYSSLSH